MKMSLNGVSRRMPLRPSFGAQKWRESCQAEVGRSSSRKRRPHSSTATREPFAASRTAATLPPDPEPMTIQSKSRRELSIGPPESLPRRKEVGDASCVDDWIGLGSGGARVFVGLLGKTPRGADRDRDERGTDEREHRHLRESIHGFVLPGSSVWQHSSATGCGGSPTEGGPWLH